LVRSGKPITEITSFAILVEIDNIKAALRWMLARVDNKPTETIKSIAVGLQIIAKYQVGVDDTQLETIRGIVRRFGRETGGLREKNRQRLLQLDDSDNLARLLHLPAALVTKAHRLFDAKPRKAALLVQAALAVEILLNAPMRVGNLSSLHLTTHLKPIKVKRDHRTHIHIPAHCAVTSVAIEDPKHIGIAAAILGHTDPRTTEKHYIQAQQLHACRALGQSLKALRAQSPPNDALSKKSIR
jgi:hypothetical protein